MQYVHKPKKLVLEGMSTGTLALLTYLLFASAPPGKC
jgi:hypothetical protein